MFEEMKENSTFSFDYSQVDEISIGRAALPLIQINLYSSNSQISFRRKYIKVQEILANIGGLFQFFHVICDLVSYYFTKVKMNTELLNKLHDYVEVKSLILKKKPKLRISIPAPVLTTSGNQVNINTNSFKRAEKKSFSIKGGRQLENKQKVQLLFTNIEIIRAKMLCFLSNREIKLKWNVYELSMKRLSKLLDVSQILYKQIEYEKFKFLFLKPEQVCLFNLISKEQFIMCDREKEVDVTAESHTKCLDIIESPQYMIDRIRDYENELLKNVKQITSIDEKLFSWLSDDVKKILKNNAQVKAFSAL